ncbi:MAG: hypothetical protein H6895_06900 [Defluviimonas sp.]|uniref:hypothetical protein n=1 Tax=Albidovulum sp. TaxID=1872424 RepID=UPI001D8DF075|nr:hypothetical protein [Paracoccaceae bacterium]MCC0063799.1 hypothetical protein [Defluviimonas sp.]
MNAELTPRTTPATAVRTLVAEYGLLRVALALAGHVAQRRAPNPRRRSSDLSDHLRRDIGLGLHERGRNYWEL